MKFNFDCIHFLGERPCRHKRECPGCKKYQKTGKMILIIKLGSLGDVLRTTPLASGLKKRYPFSRITWITSKDAVWLLENNPFIDEVLPYGVETLVRTFAGRFDLLISLDKTPESTGLAEIINASKKSGFGMSRSGAPYPFNKGSEYAFRLGISDDLKFRKNKKSYQKIIFEIAGLEYGGEEYLLNLSEAQKEMSEALTKRFGIRRCDVVIGFNTGCGDAFQGKKWTIANYLRLGAAVKNNLGAKILLLGGPSEVERNSIIRKKAGFPLVDTGCANSLKDFVSIVNLCDLVVSGDTVAMHIAIALKKKVVALFGPTVPQEIDMYGRGKKIFLNTSCSPCYKRICDRAYLCMEKIDPETVFKKIEGLLKSGPR